MKQTSNYIEDITKDLSFIPEKHLATLRDMIRLIATPYKEEVKQEEKQISLKEVENYVQYFRQSYELILKKNLHLEARYQFRDDNLVLIQWIETEEKGVEISEITEDIDLPKLIEENEKEHENFMESIEEDTQILFTEKDIIFCKSTKLDFWTQDEAQADARKLFGIFVEYMPKYKEEADGIS